MTDVNNDPNLHWNGSTWLRWNGAQWTDAESGQPVVDGATIPPPASGSRKGKGCLIGLAVGGGVLLVLIIIAAIAGGGSQSKSSPSTPPSSSPSAAPSSTQSSSEVPAGGSSQIGEPVRDGQFEFTVASVEYEGESIGTGYSRETAQGEWFIVNLNVKNIGDSAQLMTSGDQKAINAQNQEFSDSPLATVALNGNNSLFVNQINPGNSVTGKIAFDVPKGTKVVKLQLHDSMFSNGVEVSLV